MPEELDGFASTLRCGYCNQFLSGSTQKSGSAVERKCTARQINVGFDHKTCKYFDPVKFFHCDKHGERITFAECMNRRFNYSKLDKYIYCKKCRQFDNEVNEIASRYFLDATKVKKYNPDKPLRKLARRNKPDRKIKRRTPKKEKRVLKKRIKKPIRKIKRRK